MTIGEALRKERLKLGLTQSQMCEGIVSRPFYAKVESGKHSINADLLFKILTIHQIDVVEFYSLIKDIYISPQEKLLQQLQDNMEFAVNTVDFQKLEKYKKKILLTNNNILKLRTIVTIAYFKDDLSSLDSTIQKELKKEFDEGKNWINRPDILKLFANTMPIWLPEELDFFIGRLLSVVKKNNNLSELILERYFRIFGNYLVTCYTQKNTGNHVNEVINYMLNEPASFHLMIYKIHTSYMKALFDGDISKAKNIKKSLGEYGYKETIANWSL